MAKKEVDICSLLCSHNRDFLVRSNGDPVSTEALKGKKLGLYFSASWCGSYRHFTPTLVEVYNEIVSRTPDFEIIFVTSDEDDESFRKYSSKMPWLAIPFSDSQACDELEDLFNVKGLPRLVILDENGNVLTDEGVDIIRDHEAEAYPFTPERMQELKELEEAARREQTLRSLLVYNSLDFVLSDDRTQVLVSELEGKTVGLYFSLSSHRSCINFTPVLADVYEKVKAKGLDFEIVLVPLDDEEESFKEIFGKMSWYSLPLRDKRCIKLARYFDLSTLPTLVIIGPDGRTLHPNATEVVEDHGVQAYPFTLERFSELAELEKACQEAQTLESLLVSGDLNFVVGKNGAKVPVSQLKGKNILLYFSASWCPPCRAYLPKLIEAYHQVKAEDNDFEIVFISGDRDLSTFEDFFGVMPWLALPFGDQRISYLCHKFKVFGIPKLVAIGTSGKTVSTEARELIMVHGPKAYPFTAERLQEIESELNDMASGWPNRVNHSLHEEHELVLTRHITYTCNGCDKDGHIWSFNCEECNFDLHPRCALVDENDVKGRDDWEDGGTSSSKWIDDGHLCARS